MDPDLIAMCSYITPVEVLGRSQHLPNFQKFLEIHTATSGFHFFRLQNFPNFKNTFKRIVKHV